MSQLLYSKFFKGGNFSALMTHEVEECMLGCSHNYRGKLSKRQILASASEFSAYKIVFLLDVHKYGLTE